MNHEISPTDSSSRWYNSVPLAINIVKQIFRKYSRVRVKNTVVTTDGDHTIMEVIVGLICIYRRDIQCLNNSVMGTIIICPEAVICKLGGDLKVEIEWRFMLHVYVENNL